VLPSAESSRVSYTQPIIRIEIIIAELCPLVINSRHGFHFLEFEGTRLTLPLTSQDARMIIAKYAPAADHQAAGLIVQLLTARRWRRS